MKKTKIIVPALALLVLSTAASVSGTVAWFSANQTVTASGMSVKAKAQAGLVISNTAAGTYNAAAESAKTACAELYPASTADLSTWLTSASTNPAQANTEQAYTAATPWTAAVAPAEQQPGSYIVHDFYIRSSAAAALTVSHLDVKEVNVTENGSDGFDNLSKSLRVGIKFDGSSNHYIYGPVAGYTATVSVQNAAGAYSSVAADRTDVSALAYNTLSTDTSITSIPASTANGLHASVYVWFEGEDANCISNNIISGLETLSISVVFGYNLTNA